MRFHFAETMDEVLDLALVPARATQVAVRA
jgi:hypothetical protein